MPCWYYEKSQLRNTPSIQDGIDYETECRYRKEGARFIMNIMIKGNPEEFERFPRFPRLSDSSSHRNLGYNTMATAVVYFHRFYMVRSFQNFPRYVTACCCLYIANKVAETPKKCEDIIRIAKTFMSEQDFMTFGEDPKKEVLNMERVVLETIKFDLIVEHPYSYLQKYAKCLKVVGYWTDFADLFLTAWIFLDRSLCTTLSLRYKPDIIAVALIYLQEKYEYKGEYKVVDWINRQPKHLPWWDMFVEDVTIDLLEDICRQILEYKIIANYSN